MTAPECEAAFEILFRATYARVLSYARAMAEVHDADDAVRRFRPNLVLDDGHVPGEFTEDRLMGAELRGPSGVCLAVRLPTPRCVVPTRAREELGGRPVPATP